MRIVVLACLNEGDFCIRDFELRRCLRFLTNGLMRDDNVRNAKATAIRGLVMALSSRVKPGEESYREIGEEKPSEKQTYWSVLVIDYGSDTREGD